jgi:tetratricopeptide (TPR) repeat protein
MSLKSFFPEQFDQLKAFFISGTEVVRHLKVDPEMRPMLLKALAKMEDDREFPHALSLSTEKFTEPVSYFNHLLNVVRESYEQNAPALAKKQVTLPPPFEADAPLKAPAKFTLYASSLANSLPENVGSLVFVLNPDEILDPQAFRKSILYIAENIRSNWLKFLVLDARTAPVLQNIAQDHAKIGEQTLYLSPDEIEKRVREDLQSPAGLSASEQRQYKGLLAGFAYSNRNYEEAAQLQQAWAAESEQASQHGDAASAYYNLGNTLLAKGEFAQATEVYCKACDLCVEHKVHALAPFVYVNLGVSLHRQKQFEQAFASLKVARDMFKAQKHRAGEAFVVDALAQMYALDGRKAEAEKSWRYALSLYEGMTASTFKDLRAAGREDVLAKLKQLGASG